MARGRVTGIVLDGERLEWATLVQSGDRYRRVDQGMEVLSAGEEPEPTDADDARRALLERPDRPHHAAREQEPREHRESDAGNQQHRGPRERVVKWGERFAERRFDEHQPAQWRDRRVCRQNFQAAETTGDDADLVCHRGGGSGTGCRHLRQGREIGLAQH